MTSAVVPLELPPIFQPSSTAAALSSQPFVAIRKWALRPNMAFVRLAGIDRCGTVILERDRANPQLRMTFCDQDVNGDAWFRVSRKHKLGDGPIKEGDYSIQVERLIRDVQWLNDLLEKPGMKPKKDGNSWLISPQPTVQNSPVWEIVKRGPGPRSNAPESIRINSKSISFNAIFIRGNGLQEHRQIQFAPALQNFNLWFRFPTSDEQAEHVLTISPERGSASAFREVEARKLINAIRWLKALSKMEPGARILHPRKVHGGWWMVSIPPSFELKIARELYAKIPDTGKGIYRYVNSATGVTVYIGKGNIRQRLSEAERDQWEFDRIEYSLINDEDLQYDWENFWLRRFLKAHGALPRYNKNQGILKGKLPPEFYEEL